MTLDPLGFFGVASFFGLGYQHVDQHDIDNVRFDVDKLDKKVSYVENAQDDYSEQRRVDTGLLVKTNRKLRNEIRKAQGLSPIPACKYIHFNNFGRQLVRHNVLIMRVIRLSKK